MDLTGIFSDDQLAVTGCFGALLVCGLIAAVSYHFGPAGRQSSEMQRSTAGRIVAQPVVVQSHSERKAA